MDLLSLVRIAQTSGTVMADRALLPLLKKSWPRTLDELYER
jgi:hypothetical protein